LVPESSAAAADVVGVGATETGSLLLVGLIAALRVGAIAVLLRSGTAVADGAVALLELVLVALARPPPPAPDPLPHADKDAHISSPATTTATERQLRGGRGIGYPLRLGRVERKRPRCPGPHITWMSFADRTGLDTE
jgi:hypothetical protein